ncbi:MAG TPA: methyl-accepting chemotaxis protein [Paraburkholderia sp.]|jgi:methyl-accepting chemotaxis protein-1 (serine sensor receptor)|nr:methyl-accepting chemotaxis protein [Paraburkholderia sp.]
MNGTVSIKARIGITMGFMAALLLVIGVLGLAGMSRTNGAYHETFTDQMPSAMALDLAELSEVRERLALERAVPQAGTPRAQDGIARSREFRVQSDAAWNTYRALPRDDEEERLAQTAASARTTLQQVLTRYGGAIAANQPEQIAAVEKALPPAYSQFSDASEALRKFQLAVAQRGYASAQQSFALFRWISIAAMVLGTVLAAAAWRSLRRTIGVPIETACRQFDTIASGDLRRPVSVDRRDEMGALLRGLATMQDRLASTVQTVRAGSESIALATRQIAAGNLDLSSRTEQQALSLQETAASMEELTSTVKQNADNAREARKLADVAERIASKGSEVVGQVVGTMEDISRSSARVADIIAIIEGIAFQTNILALNAAVEAARAGETGRGFAVVAEEVRSLAQRSSSAAKEIKQLIDGSVGHVQSGAALVDQAGATMTEIIGAVRRVSGIVGEIAEASAEQSGGIDQIALAVSQMDAVTQQNAALVEQASAAAQSLESQAESLRSSVAVFQVEDRSPREPVSPYRAISMLPA